MKPVYETHTLIPSPYMAGPNPLSPSTQAQGAQRRSARLAAGAAFLALSLAPKRSSLLRASLRLAASALPRAMS